MRLMMLFIAGFFVSSTAFADSVLGFGIARSHFSSRFAVLPKNFVGKEMNCVEHMINGKQKRLTITYGRDGFLYSDDDFIDMSRYSIEAFAREVSSIKNQVPPMGVGSIRFPGVKPTYSLLKARQFYDLIVIEEALYTPGVMAGSSQFPPVANMPKGADLLAYITCQL